MTKRMRFLLFLAIALCSALPLLAADPDNGEITIHRIQGAISIDGDLSDSGWQSATRVERWYETNVSDNGEPQMKSIGRLIYDDKFLYVAFELFDPNPSQISGPMGDHDALTGATDDFAGILIDARNDSKTAAEFFVNVGGVQYDAITDDTTGNEDASPDFYWDSATRRTDHGWNLEMRIPFSSLRYKNVDPQKWNIVLYRNVPRDRRYQYFSHRLPRGSNCLVCNFNQLVGLERLPSGGHLTAAPYVTGKETSQARGDVLGAPLDNHAQGTAGADVKWNPSANAALDATINPDFSQIESDVAAISTNQRFAIFYPEKRPFFLEGIELFRTPIQAVYTRTITAPQWGLRTTGKFDDDAYTLLVTQDKGGGSVVLPSPTSSSFVDQDFSSTVGIGRIRHDLGRSFVSFLAVDRESEGSAHNRVFGPDFQKQFGDHDTITGQFLISDTRTPDHPELAAEWDGRELRSHAGDIWWQHSSPKHDFYTEYKDYGDGFRADTGFVPQVGYRSNYAEYGYTVRPDGFFNRVRDFAMAQYDSTQDGNLLYRMLSVGVNTDGRHRSSMRIRYSYDSVRSGDDVFKRHQVIGNLSFAVNRVLSAVGVTGTLGQDIDYVDNRLGRGASLTANATVVATNHLQLRFDDALSWLNVSGGHLFTSQVERVRATYTFNNRMFVRAIAQNIHANQNVALYYGAADHYDGSLTTQLLFAYKLNWQSVLFVGYGDERDLTVDDGKFTQFNRQIFMKLSYAFQL